jgi:hypothetical protein
MVVGGFISRRSRTGIVRHSFYTILYSACSIYKNVGVGLKSRFRIGTVVMMVGDGCYRGEIIQIIKRMLLTYKCWWL